MRPFFLRRWGGLGPKGVFLLVGLLAFAAGYVFHGVTQPSAAVKPPEALAPAGTGAPVTIWTCSMHPQIRLPKPGKCPICFMDLVPATSESEPQTAQPRQFVTSDSTRALMQIQTSPVERRFVAAEVRMVGKVTYDETRLGYITAWVPGRLDRLYVDYTGITVQKGDHMVYLYSPEVLAAQEELRRAVIARNSLRPESPEVLRRSAENTLEAVRRKLTLWGLADGQIAQAEKAGPVSDHVTIYAPMGGTVVSKDAQQGMYVDTGTRIYTIADLSQVWVKLDAYESDLPWVRYGQKVEFATEAYPGKTFKGWIAFIDPVLDDRTRTVKVRVNVPNAEGKLKPEMFVRGVVHATVATGGRVMDPDLAGKWISPMHPEIVKDKPGTCDICGMPLVRAETLGYVPATADESAKPLVIPASAPLITGKRAVVYVEVPGTERPTFEGREIVLGPRAGDYYLVEEGLREGERVVTNGNFKIDSALQIMAKPSMMNPEGGGPPPGHAHGAAAGTKTVAAETPVAPAQEAAPQTVPVEFQHQLGAVLQTYLTLQTALAGDAPLGNVAPTVTALREALERVDMGLLEGHTHMAWMGYLDRLNPPLGEMAKAKDLEAVRSGFSVFSEPLAEALKQFGVETEAPVYQFRCTNASAWRDATWLQSGKEAHNPYLGTAMPACGTVVGQIAGPGTTLKEDVPDKSP